MLYISDISLILIFTENLSRDYPVNRAPACKYMGRLFESHRVVILTYAPGALYHTCFNRWHHNVKCWSRRLKLFLVIWDVNPIIYIVTFIYMVSNYDTIGSIWERVEFIAIPAPYKVYSECFNGGNASVNFRHAPKQNIALCWTWLEEKGSYLTHLSYFVLPGSTLALQDTLSLATCQSV